MGPLIFHFGQIYTLKCRFGPFLSVVDDLTQIYYRDIRKYQKDLLDLSQIYILPTWMYLINTNIDQNWFITFEMRAKKEVLTSNIQTLVVPSWWVHCVPNLYCINKDTACRSSASYYLLEIIIQISTHVYTQVILYISLIKICV